jgi:uncharacterized membrane protein
MNFARTLVGTVLIAIFGAVVLANVPAGPPADTLSHGVLAGTSVATFATVFLAIAGTLAVAFLSVILLEEKPLEATPPARAADATTRRLHRGAVEGNLASREEY